VLVEVTVNILEVASKELTVPENVVNPSPVVNVPEISFNRILFLNVSVSSESYVAPKLLTSKAETPPTPEVDLAVRTALLPPLTVIVGNDV